MRKETIYDAVTNLDSDLIAEAQKQRRPAVKWCAMAAAAALVIGAGSIAVPKLLGGRQGTTADGGGGGGDGGSTFMSYAGPVLPMTLGDENDSITAERAITLDFAPWVPVWITNEEDAASRDWLTEEEQRHVIEELQKVYPEGGREECSTDILVTDQYVLTNTSNEPQTVTVRYPYVTTFRAAEMPVLTIDGAKAAAETIFGSDAGGFIGTQPEDNGDWNIQEPDSWEDYRNLLASGAYEMAALSPAPDLSGTPVVVYRFANPTYTWSGEEPEHPEVVAMFDQDYDATSGLSYGFNAGSWDAEAGRTETGYSIGRPEWAEQTRYLVVIGEDIGSIQLRGGFPDTDETYEVDVDITREETDLESALREILAVELAQDDGGMAEVTAGEDTVYDAVARAFVLYGPLSENGAERYGNGMLQDFLSDVLVRQRVAYLQTEVTIPANGSVTVAVQMAREGSYDFYGAGGQHGVYGYDMTTTLASNLRFTGQSATLLDHGQLEIVRQNFGFDPENGVTTVALDLDVPHYYLEVRRASES